MLFEEVIGSYLSTRANADRDRYSLKRLNPHFFGRQIPDLRRADLRNYIAARLSQGVKQSTVRRELRIFSAAINFCRLELDRPDLPNPVAALGLSEEEGRVRWLTREEATRLISCAEEALRPHLPCFIRLALNTGCRRGELLNLEWNRVDTGRQQILLEARHNKSRRRQTVPLNMDAISALNRMKEWQATNAPGTPWVFGKEGGNPITTFKTSWTSALKRAGITDFRIHDLRHTFASWLVMQGIDLYVVKELLRHSSVTVTEKYAHLAPSKTADAVQRLLPF